MVLYFYTVSLDGGYVDKELSEHVMIERVEMIARLTVEGTCRERDREIALGLIAEIAKGAPLINNEFTVIFSASHVKDKVGSSCECD